MRAVLLLLIIATGAACKSQEPPALFQIIENGQYGFIDSTGKKIIKPQYAGAGVFAEGLAPVRINGRYGYINAAGKLVIPAEFDYGWSFNNGEALVYKNGKPFIIDQRGKPLFNHPFAYLGTFHNKRSIVRTESGKYGMIDKKGKLIADTVYYNINATPYNTFIVRREAKPKYEFGLIDENGKFLVPFGKYSDIQRYENGYAQVQIAPREDDESGESAINGFIDSTGKFVFGRDHKSTGWMEGATDGLVKLTDNLNANISYADYVDFKGTKLLNATKYKSVYDFHSGRAFVEDNLSQSWIIDRKGRFVGSESFDYVVSDRFFGNIAFVRNYGSWKAIDTNAHVLFTFDCNDVLEQGIHEDYFIFMERANNNRGEVFGVADMKGKVMIPAKFEDLDPGGFRNGLLYVVEDDRFGYVDRKGKYVWRQPKEPKEPKAKSGSDTLDIDFMNRGYFTCSSLPDEVVENGQWVSHDHPQKINSDKSFAEGKFTMEARPQDTCTWEDNFAGIKLYVANDSRDTIVFEAQDSRLYLKLQAIDGNGKWKDIEYLPSSFCGNSYHTVRLPPHYYFQFAMPVYKGVMKTKLRAQLVYLKPGSEKESLILYSNEFEGSVNPAQFWRKQEYYPQGIMDPYRE